MARPTSNPSKVIIVPRPQTGGNTTGTPAQAPASTPKVEEEVVPEEEKKSDSTVKDKE